MISGLLASAGGGIILANFANSLLLLLDTRLQIVVVWAEMSLKNALGGMEKSETSRFKGMLPGSSCSSFKTIPKTHDRSLFGEWLE